MGERMKKQYRVVTDEFLGFRAEWSYRWWPFWGRCTMPSTCASIEDAKKDIEKHKRKFHISKEVWRENEK